MSNVIEYVLAQHPRWAPYKEKLQKVVEFLGYKSYRLVWQQRMGADPRKKQLDHFAASFATWRFETHYITVHSVNLLIPIFDTWDAAMFESTQDPKLLQKTDSAICSKEFLEDTMNFDELLCLLWHASQWGTGCRCHEDQLLRGETVVCDRKSRRMDQAKPYITILRNNLESTADNFSLDKVDGDHTRRAHWQNSYRYASGLVFFRFGFLFRIPYLCAWLMDPVQNKECWRQYLSTHEENHHRRSVMLFSMDTALGRQAAVVRTGGLADPQLQDAVQEILDLPFSEIPAEALHRDVSGEARRAPGASEAWLIASLTVKDNVGIFEHLNEKQLEEFVQDWMDWKKVGQNIFSSPRVRRRSVHMKDKHFIDWLYQLNECSLLGDWGELGLAVREAYKDLLTRGDAITRLKTKNFDLQLTRQYLESVLEPHTIYSTITPTELRTEPVGPPAPSAPVVDPRVQPGTPDLPPVEVEVDAEPRSDDDVIIEDADPNESAEEVPVQPLLATDAVIPYVDPRMPTYTVFQPLEIISKARGVVKTYEFRCDTYVLPAIVQRWRVVEPSMDLNPTRLSVQRVGSPTKIDLATVAGPLDLVNKMHKWTVNTTHSAGCMELTDPVLVRSQFALLDKESPLWPILVEFKNRGWMPVGGKIVHDAKKPITNFSFVKSISQRSYFQCLLDWPRLVAGGLKNMHSGQIIAYYSALFAGKHVLPGLREKEYLAILNDAPLPSLPLPPPTVDPCIEDVLEDDVIVDDEPEPPQRAREPAQGRLGNGPGTTLVRGLFGPPSDDESDVIVNTSPTRSPPKEHHGESDDDNEDVVIEEEEEIAELLPGIPSKIDGVEVALEEWKPETEPGYSRVHVKCPVHLFCSMRRSVGVKATRRYGNKEVHGFVGAWLACVVDFTGARAGLHKEYKPSDVEVTAWLTERGLLDH